MPSPIVPHGYVLANTYESPGNLDETKSRVECSIKDAFTFSPDKLLYVCRQIYKQNLFTFHVLLFHSEKGEFIEVKYFGKNREAFYEVELNFATLTGFTPSERNRKPMDYQFRSVPFPISFMPELSDSDVLMDKTRIALHYTDTNASKS